jgi:hypothetical protein
MEMLEAGQPLPPHFATCPDCLKARATYERLTKVLSAPGAPLETEKWEAGVWEKILHPEAVHRTLAARAGWRNRWLAAAAAAAVLVGVVETVRRQGTKQASQTLLALRLEGARHPGSGTRGTPDRPVHHPPPDSRGTIYLQPGDELVFDAGIGAARYAEIRVYREDRELRLRCPPGCKREGERITGRFTLPAIGRYQVYVVASDDPLPEPAPTLAADTERLVRAGARIALGVPVQAY